MYNEKKIITYILIIMFSFFAKSEAKYEKLFFQLEIKDIEGNLINFSNYQGKTILLTNVASKCGFTKQYAGLQKLYEKYKNRGFIIIGIPSNQFGGQEPGTNKEIKNFCETNFNISFIMTEKVLVKGTNAHPIYLWAMKNHGKSTIPKWNFHKILINKNGKVQNTFSSFVSPLSKKIINEIEEIL
jgi:glutathione peroxidase